MQPHLKKCFEGINKLEFTEQQEIVGMISAEKEMVPFSGRIFPAKAKVSFFLLLCLLCIVHILFRYYFNICYICLMV